MKLKESTTFVNLARAFAGECQDGARYQFLKDKAEREGLAYVGQICTEHATNEMKHAKVFYDFITDNGTERVPNIEFTAGYPFKAGTLNEEIKSVAQDELNQATTIYPDFAQVAKDEGFHDVAQAFELIAEVERSHYLVLEQIYAKLEKDKLYNSEKAIQWKCTECGHEDTRTAAWTECPLCHSAQGEVKIPLEF